jgi:hypothetical protein
MTAAEAKATARQAIEAQIRAARAASDQRLLEAVLAGDIDVDAAAATWTAIHFDIEAQLPDALRTAYRTIDRLTGEGRQ